MFGYDVEDAAACTVEHTSGVVGTILTIFNGVRGREERRLEVFFEQGAVEVTTDFLVGAPEDGFLIQRPDRRRSGSTWAPCASTTSKRRASRVATSSIYLYPAARAFVRAVRHSRPGSPGFADTLRAHALVEAAYR